MSRSSAQVFRGFHQRARDVLEGCVDGQKDERRVNVREHNHDGERAVKKEGHGLMGEMQVFEEAIEHAFAAENGLPSIAAHQVAHPQRHDNQLVEQLFRSTGMKRQVIGQRVAE